MSKETKTILAINFIIYAFIHLFFYVALDVGNQPPYLGNYKQMRDFQIFSGVCVFLQVIINLFIGCSLSAKNKKHKRLPGLGLSIILLSLFSVSTCYLSNV